MRILSLPVDRGGCGYYRIRQPLKMVKRHTAHDAHVIDKDEDDPLAVTTAFTQADIAIVRQGGEDGMRRLRAMPEFKHLKWVMDIDDNIELISPYSEHYKEYGQEPFQDIWVDGEHDFDVARNRARVASLLFGLEEADLVTVTTEKLAAYARQYNDHVAVLPNLVDTDVWWKLPLTRRKALRVGWAGGVSHYEDWYTIREPLNRILRNYPDVTLVSVGAHFPGIIDADLRERVEVHPWVPFAAHSYRMMALALDIAIIPLADLPFNHYKSPIKFLEMSAMGVPAVVANVPPYRGEVTPNETGLVYTTPAEFAYQLERLLTIETLRRRIGEQAYDWVSRERSAQMGAEQWINAYSSLLT